MSNISALEPQNLWKNFDQLNAVPRPSKKEERVIAFAKQFGESLGLVTMVDEIGNVIIKKPATPGMENRKKIVMQSHLDMVHQKNSDTEFNFDTEGIRMLVEGDWVKADGTTLGADMGLVLQLLWQFWNRQIFHILKWKLYLQSMKRQE